MSAVALAPLGEADARALARVTTVLTDIDDTLTSEGRLPASAYAALEALAAAGLRVIPLTGRPAGWCDLIARFWPVAGVVGENGALAYRYDHGRRRMLRLYQKTEAERHADQARLAELGARILREVPGAAIAADQPFRVADLAIDFCEDVVPLGADAVERIVRIFTDAGAAAKVSSIHVNGWFGDYDKLSMTRRLLHEAFGQDDLADALFIGDSPNDEPMFRAAPISVGVANVRDFQLAAPPHYVTRGRGGAGFVELAETLLRARRAGA